jgi:ankyrin repeat protein
MYKLLIEKGADIHQPTTNKSTPLGAAVAAGNLDACKLLLSLGADINHIDDFDFSILDIAVASDNPEIVEYLLNAGLTLSNFDKKNHRLSWLPPRNISIQ